VSRYGFENLELYFRYAGYARHVFAISPADRDREGFERLVELALATRGSDIPLPGVLGTLRLKDIAELVADLDPPPFRRKATAIDYLVTVPDIQQRLGKHIAMRSFFALQPLPAEFAHIDVVSLGRSWAFTSEVVELLARTYTSARHAIEDEAKHHDPDLRSMIVGWELMTAADTPCPSCRRAAKRYNAEPPRTPLHIGCRCSVEPVYGSE